MKKVLTYLKKYLLWVIGSIFIVLYLYSNMFFDSYKVSFASHMYLVAPWNSESVETDGPIFSDIEDSEYPALYASFKNGEKYSLWNNKVALGTTDSINYIMYPLNYLYLLPMDIAVWLKTVIEFIIAFIGIYLLLREYQCLKIASSIGGIIYAFSSTMVMWLGWSHSDVAAWAPFAFFLAEKIICQMKIKYTLWLSIIIYMMLIAGMPTFAAYFMYLLGFYFLFKTIHKYWKEKKKIFLVFGLFGISVLLGVLLSLPYTFSLIQSVGKNGYAESRGYQALATLSTEYLRTMIYPYFREGLNIHVNESTLYVGMLTIFMLPFSFVRKKEKKQTVFWGIASIIIVIVIFSHVFDSIYVLMPMINTSLKYRNITLLMFTMSILTGINLNDILKMPEYYKKKGLLLGIWFVWGVTIITISSGKLLLLADDDNDNISYYDKVLALFLAFYILISLYIVLKKKLFAVAIIGFVIWDMCGFANKYLPWIEKNAEIIPAATDSIEYLQENTTNHSRIVGIGDWTLMANANCYYNLWDIRAHSFVMTNSDIRSYYEEISETCYASATRIAFDEISNYNLLKYIGVKYIVGTRVTKNNIYNSALDSYAVTELLNGKEVLEQEFRSKNNNLYAIQLLAGTFATEFTQNEKIKVSVVEVNTDKIVAETELSLTDISDNAYVRICFGRIENSNKKKYKLVLEMPENMEEKLAFYKTAEDEDLNKLYIDGKKQTGHLIMQTEYLDEVIEEIYKGEDNLIIAQMNEYAPKVMFAKNIIVKDSEQDVLEAMSKEYIADTVFVSRENINENILGAGFSETDSIDLVEYAADYVKIKYTAETDCYIVLNDYYDNHWKAYINGEEVNLIRANYLLRAVEASKGIDVIIEMKYDYGTMFGLFAITISSAVVIILLGCFSRKMQKKIDIIAKFNEKTAEYVFKKKQYRGI